jgi:hypothetical protein
VAEAPPNGVFWSALDRALELAEVDGDQLVVDLDPCGPAGASSIELPGGELVQVEHLDPTRLIGVEADAGDPGGSSLLVALFGGDGALMLAERARRNAGSTTRRRPGRDEAGPPISRQRTTWLDVVARRVGRLVVLADLCTDVAVDPLARVAAVAELVTSLDDVEGGDLFGPLVPGLLRRGADAAAQVDEDTVEDLDPQLAHRLAGALGALLDAIAVGPTGPPGAAVAQLRRVLDLLEAHRDARVAAAMAPADGLVDAFMEELFSDGPVFEDAVPARRSAPTLSFVRRSPSLLEVTAPRVHESAWVRVLRTDGLVPLAAAPLRPDGLMLRAELLVPPDTATADLGLQLVGPDELRVLSGAPADVVRRAVRAGRAAASAERHGDSVEAGIRWRRCAELWSRVGDDRRSDQAIERATSGGGRSTVEPMLADELDPFGTDVFIDSDSELEPGRQQW